MIPKIYNIAKFNEDFDTAYYSESFFTEFGIQPSSALQLDQTLYTDRYEQWKMENKESLLNYSGSKDNFNQLVEVTKRKKIVPFVGSGLSVSSGFQTWSSYLKALGNEISEIDKINEFLALEQYEEAAEFLLSKLGESNFNAKVDSKFGNVPKPIKGLIKNLPKITNGTIVTTNFDKLVEEVFSEHGIRLDVIHGNEDKEFHRSFVRGDNYLLKLHGSIQDSRSRVFTKTEYDCSYLENGEIDFNKPLPENLSKIYMNSTLLFLGCSLENDRTLQLFKMLKETQTERKIPRHYAIIGAPEDLTTLAEREKFLTEHMIFPIWYPYGEFDKLEEIFELFLYEVENE